MTNKHYGKIETKTLQTNIAVNGLYDTRLCEYLEKIWKMTKWDVFLGQSIYVLCC